VFQRLIVEGRIQNAFHIEIYTNCDINIKAGVLFQEKIIQKIVFIQYTLVFNIFAAVIDIRRFNNSCLRLPASTTVDLIFQLLSFSFTLADLLLQAGNLSAATSVYLADVIFIPFIVCYAYIAM
jgi:hypothetical protein